MVRILIPARSSGVLIGRCELVMCRKPFSVQASALKPASSTRFTHLCIPGTYQIVFRAGPELRVPMPPQARWYSPSASMRSARNLPAGTTTSSHPITFTMRSCRVRSPIRNASSSHAARY